MFEKDTKIFGQKKLVLSFSFYRFQLFRINVNSSRDLNSVTQILEEKVAQSFQTLAKISPTAVLLTDFYKLNI